MSRCPTCGHDSDPSVTMKEALVASIVGFTIILTAIASVWLLLS